MVCFAFYILGPYPEPYLLVRTTRGIVAVDLVTLDSTDLISWAKTYEYGLDVDMKEGKLHFANQQHIYQANLDGTDNKTVIRNASANDVAIDSKGRRILWNDYAGKEIFVMNLETKERKVLIKCDDVMHIEVDSVER